MNDRRWTTSVTLALLAVSALHWSCSGPQPLSRAIQPADKAAYAAILEAPAGPREAFYQWKARTDGISVDAVRAGDADLSESRNPYRRKDATVVSRGAVVYKYQCARCHGVNVDGRGPEIDTPTRAMDFRRFGRRFSITVHGGAPSTWFTAIRDGAVTEAGGAQLVMPPFEQVLAREQIWQMVTYLQSLDADLLAAPPSLPPAPNSPEGA